MNPEPILSVLEKESETLIDLLQSLKTQLEQLKSQRAILVRASSPTPTIEQLFEE